MCEVMGRLTLLAIVAGSAVGLHGCDDRATLPGSCARTDDCGPLGYCHFAEGCTGTVGECRPVPQTCAAIYIPICACDGNTYGNECQARMMRVQPTPAASCPPSVVCTTFDAGYEQVDCVSTISCQTIGQCPTTAPVKCAGAWACRQRVCVYQCGAHVDAKR
jgi:hypothetical protein